jgi:PrtD family type I secretion system ABC transporter
LALCVALSVGGSLLQLAVPLYSLQVYDRVLPSGHLETLLLLSLMAATTLLVIGVLDALKAAVLQRLATRVGDRLGREVLSAVATGGGSAGAGLRELETVRAVLAGPATAALFELPWLPLAVAVTWLLHPTLGAFTAAAVLFLLLLGGINHALTRPRVRRAHELGLEAQTRGEAVSRHGDVVRAMGLLPALEARFAEVQSRALLLQQRAGEHGGWLNGLVRATRLAVQAAAMGLGAWLVVADEMTPGALIAGTILVSRALAPVEQALFGWRGLVQLRDSLGRLESLLARGARRGPAPMPLPAPRGRLELEGVGMATPEGRALLRDVSLALPAGTALAVVGPSAAGKTTLCRLIAGCVAPSRGRLRLDGADYVHLAPEQRGPHVGYLPQEPALFAGTVAANIARMVPRPDPERVVDAARLAGVHEMVLGLPEGYDTVLGEGGLPLSGGQRQRVALARALYGSPRLVVLDEPNSNLDPAGEAALVEALKGLKAAGATVVTVTHRPSLVAHADLVLVLEGGAVARLGPRDEVMRALMRPARAA